MKTLYTLMFLCTLTLWACGDDDPSSDSNNSGANNGDGNNVTQKDESSFKTKTKDDAGKEKTIENKVDNDKASKQMGGASIAGSVLSVFLVAPNGDTIQAIVETTEALTAPGTFSVNQPPEGSFVTWTSPATGEIYESTSGSIVLDGCPKVVGTQVKGSLKDVSLNSALSGATTTLNGTFDMVLFAKAGDLFCKPDASENNTDNNANNDSNNDGGTCGYTEACDQDEGTCCPYAPCLTQCQLRCFQTPACSDPFNPDLAACAACSDECLDSCDVDAACREDLVALNTCEEQAGCDAFGDEDTYNACVKGSCCAEVTAAF